MEISCLSGNEGDDFLDCGYSTGSPSDASTENSLCCSNSCCSPPCEANSSPLPEPMYLIEIIAVPVFYGVWSDFSVHFHDVTSCAEVAVGMGRQSTVPSKRQLVKWSLPPPSGPVVPLPRWQPMPYGLEDFWTSAFAWFFRPYWVKYQHIWTLQPVLSVPAGSDWAWHSVSYSAKVRFQCHKKHGWTSMKGTVIFWFRLIRQGNQTVSEVLFKLFGQQCHQCSTQHSQVDFVPALWYPEEIEYAIEYLSSQISSVYYGSEPVNRPLRAVRRQGSSSNYHDYAHCQACHEGICHF